MINALELFGRLKGEYDKTKQPLKERASVFPLGQYEDGSVGLAWPGLLAQPVESFARMADSPMPAVNDDDAWRQMSRDSFDAAGLAMTGGLGLGLAGGMADNALGSAGGRLAKGTDLPMDLASRMARAKEIGFDTETPLYHGTRSEFSEFSPSNSGTMGPGVYLTNDAAQAGDFARFASGGSGPSVMPLMARGPLADVGEFNALLGAFSDLPYREAQREAVKTLQDAGYSGVRYGQEVSIFDPSNIRSTAAAFDPAKSDSANLLAANAKPGAAVPLAGEASQDENAALIEYLKAIGLY